MAPNKKEWVCTICSEFSSSSAAHSRHSKIHSNEDPKFKCTGCDRGFDRKDNFVRHQISCEKKSNKEKTEFAEAETDGTNGKKYFLCTICKRSYSSYSNLKKHQHLKHQACEDFDEDEEIINLNLSDTGLPSMVDINLERPERLSISDETDASMGSYFLCQYINDQPFNEAESPYSSVAKLITNEDEDPSTTTTTYEANSNSMDTGNSQR